MLEDTLLIWKFKRGSSPALERIYAKYKNCLLKLALSLLADAALAEDVVHDVFVRFAQSSAGFRLRGSLKSYLATCVANRARNVNKSRCLRNVDSLDDCPLTAATDKRPDYWLIRTEQLDLLSAAMSQLPYEQREAITLHLDADMAFKAIAEFQNVSVNTALSRYRYGLTKLRSVLDGEVTK